MNADMVFMAHNIALSNFFDWGKVIFLVRVQCFHNGFAEYFLISIQAVVSRGEYGVLGLDDECWPPTACMVPSLTDKVVICTSGNIDLDCQYMSAIIKTTTIVMLLNLVNFFSSFIVLTGI